jgi:hypothetical protein
MSWDGRISQVSISEVNSAVGYSSTAQTSLNDTRFRNLANKTGSGTTIPMADLRFGLQLPLVEFTSSNTAILEVEDASAVAGYSFASISIQLNSNGTGSYNYTYINNSPSSASQSFTWLTVGSASDYECQMTVHSGSLSSSSGTGTSLSLSSTRFWTLSAEASGGGGVSQVNTFEGTLVITRSGVVGPFRRYSLSAGAASF